MTNNQNTNVEELQRIVIKEELMALIETYYGNKNGIHMRAAFLNNLIFWQGIQLKTDKKQKQKIEKAIVHNVSPKSIEKMKTAYRNGWFYKTAEDHTIELMGFCSPSSISRMNKEFKEQGWIELGKNPDPKFKYDKSTWYRLNLEKINEDLNKLGYHLDGFKVVHIKSEDKPAPQSNFHGERSNFHGERSNFHGESSICHDGRAITEGITESVSESPTKSVCNEEAEIITLLEKRSDIDPHTHAKIIKLLNIVKTRPTFTHSIFVDTLNLVDFEIDDISYFKAAIKGNLKKGYVHPATDKAPNGSAKKEIIPDWFDETKQTTPVAHVENVSDQKAEIERMLQELRD
ncbi:hypothetical protein JMM81_10735 [Bacillus sp. V3B]|uniref:hypothetical protein n=1 Tax=Bacillus sp. V3B TaxID=2804915 RepID=UPI0021088D00|nr:hypothetical protein [Bacillus sp. V3B]MCQ6275435.1 hypothetical protein [Bacillus sp. V3B]